MPEISVIVPVYNSEKYLSKCLESLVNQTFQDIEIICIDDGSTDKSLEILKNYAKKDKRIRVLSQENQGVSAARNKAMENASGKWLAFCDSDDTVPLDAYKKMYEKGKDKDIVIGAYAKIEPNSVKYQKIRTKKNESVFSILFYTPTLWNKLIKRELVLQNDLIFKNVLLGEDVIFLCSLLPRLQKITVISDNVYFYYRHDIEESLSHTYNYRYFQAHIYCREYLLDQLRSEEYFPEVQKYVYEKLSVLLIEYIFRITDLEDKEKAFVLLKKYLINDDFWLDKNNTFKTLFGISYDEFKGTNVVDYFFKTEIFNHSEMVLKQYETGMLGFRYILKYIKAWAGYKWNRMKLERKK